MAGQHLILAGDIGGTKTNLAPFGVAGRSLAILRQERFPSAEYPGLNAMLREFLGTDTPPVLAAGFGVPGVVGDGRAKPTNLTWGVDAAEISQESEFAQVAVLNDLEADAHGIAHFKPAISPWSSAGHREPRATAASSLPAPVSAKPGSTGMDTSTMSGPARRALRTSRHATNWRSPCWNT
jgi:glucokinase